MAECYMCSKEAISLEHVPPRCIFPESKDLPSGVNYRKNLIKVPSCAEHNLQKSGDDEYLLFVLVNNFDVNSVGLRQWSTKIKRSLKRRPTKLGIFRNIKPVVYRGVRTGTYEIDIKRIFRQFDRISRGIYYHHFQKHWPHEFDIIFPAAISKNKQLNQVAREAATFASKGLQYETKFGDNPEIFFYQHK